MTEWNSDMDDAPKDGTPFTVRVGRMEFPAMWAAGFMNSAGEHCLGLVAVEEGNHPEDWTDGACWESNSYEVPSSFPTHWKPLPPETAS